MDKGSVSAAARDSNITQSAVTKRVQRLEISLGTTLIDRRQFGLTEIGQSVAGLHFPFKIWSLQRTSAQLEPVLSSLNHLLMVQLQKRAGSRQRGRTALES